MQESVKEWFEISEYDLQSAEAMFSTGRYLYVAFMSQQAIEKILKAIYIKKNNELPPRTHNLIYLVDVLKLVMDVDAMATLSRLNQYYIQGRYPGERMQLAKDMDNAKAKELLDNTKEIWGCLKQQLT